MAQTKNKTTYEVEHTDGRIGGYASLDKASKALAANYPDCGFGPKFAEFGWNILDAAGRTVATIRKITSK